jgi:phosphate uptake regulator
MEYRKLISFGKSSFVVSIPKPWINKQNLKKGDVLYFEETEENLILSAKEKETDEEKKTTINIDGKTISQIQREITPAYIKNFKRITIIGKEIKDKAKDIEPIIQNMIALEIMEQTSSRIVAKDFLNMKDISINNLIRKMDVITRSMIEDSSNMFKEDSYENINHRDKDVNRLSYLVFRVVNYCLEKPSFSIKQFNLNNHELVKYYLLAYHIEAIADEARRIARYMKKVNLSKTKEKQFVDLFNQAKSNYLDTMKAFHNKDVNLGLQVAERKRKLMLDYEKFYLENHTVQWTAYLIDRLKRMTGSIHKLGRLVYE